MTPKFFVGSFNNDHFAAGGFCSRSHSWGGRPPVLGLVDRQFSGWSPLAVNRLPHFHTGGPQVELRENFSHF